MPEVSTGLIRATQETLEKLAGRFPLSAVREEAQAAARRAGVIDTELGRAAQEALALLRTRGVNDMDQLRVALDQVFSTRLKVSPENPRAGVRSRSRITAFFGQAPDQLLRFGQALEQEIPFLKLVPEGPTMRAENTELFADLRLMMAKDDRNVRVTIDNGWGEFPGGLHGVLLAARWVREYIMQNRQLPPTSRTDALAGEPGGTVEAVWVTVPRKVYDFGKSLHQQFDGQRFQAQKNGAVQAPMLGRLRMELDEDGRNVRLTMGEATREFSAGPKGVAQATEWIRKHLN